MQVDKIVCLESYSFKSRPNNVAMYFPRSFLRPAGRGFRWLIGVTGRGPVTKGLPELAPDTTHHTAASGHQAPGTRLRVAKLMIDNNVRWIYGGHAAPLCSVVSGPFIAGRSTWRGLYEPKLRTSSVTSSVKTSRCSLLTAQCPPGKINALYSVLVN